MDRSAREVCHDFLWERPPRAAARERFSHAPRADSRAGPFRSEGPPRFGETRMTISTRSVRAAQEGLAPDSQPHQIEQQVQRLTAKADFVSAAMRAFRDLALRESLKPE